MNITELNGGTIKHWTKGVPIDSNTMNQAINVAKMDFIHKHVALMPDCHFGRGATVGSVIATKKAIIPASVGVDLGCGMIASQTTLTAKELPDTLKEIRELIERKVPLGKGGTNEHLRQSSLQVWRKMVKKYEDIIEKHPNINTKNNPAMQLGSLGGGNHFIEVCLDTEDNVWIMLHSGSRGIGNLIGRYFIEKAKEEMVKNHVHLVDKDLAYFQEGSAYFDDYWEAVKWAQDYAKENREIMFNQVLASLREVLPRKVGLVNKMINCHHNYVDVETHFGENVYVTRKGAVRAREGDMCIIPGSMGAKSFIAKGKGNPESFHSCSHGAGRVMSRGQAKKSISIEEHIKATEGVECKKDKSVIDESPSAYKDIDTVMEAQKDLVEPVHQLKQILCVKG